MPAQYTTLDILRGEVLAHVTKALNRELNNSSQYFSYPPDVSLGDISFSCFAIAKEEGESPEKIAAELSQYINQNIEKEELVERAASVGPYINFHAKNISAHVLEEIEHKGIMYGRKRDRGKTILFEFSSPNTHKSFHVGHVRGTVLGQAMVNIFRATGHEVIPINYSGDVGAHIEKILWMAEKNHHGEKPKEHKNEYLGNIYAEAEHALEKNHELQKEVDETRKKMMKGNRQLVKLWKKTRKWSIDEFTIIYKELGVDFERWYFESEFEKKGKKMVKKLLKRGIAIESNGAVIIDLNQFDLDVLVLIRTDGTPLYGAKDIPYAEKRAKDFVFDELIIQIDVRQDLYFKQLTKTLELMDYGKPMSYKTYDFVELPTGAMSSRKGNVVTYENIRDYLIQIITKEIMHRHADWDTKKIHDVSYALALGTIKFEMLKIDTQKKIVFDIKKSVSFDGFTASYLLYSVARINSILRKSKSASNEIQYHLLTTKEELAIVHVLLRFPEIVADAAHRYNPALLVKYLFDLTKQFSSFYHIHSILEAGSEELVHARIALITQVKTVIRSGLSLLGITPVDEM